MIVVTGHSTEGYIHELKGAFKEGYDDAQKELKDSSYLEHESEDVMRAYLVGWRLGATDREKAVA